MFYLLIFQPKAATRLRALFPRHCNWAAQSLRTRCYGSEPWATAGENWFALESNLELHRFVLQQQPLDLSDGIESIKTVIIATKIKITNTWLRHHEHLPQNISGQFKYGRL